MKAHVIFSPPELAEGDVRVVEGAVIRWDGEKDASEPGLMTQVLRPRVDAEGDEIYGSKWHDLCPLCDLKLIDRRAFNSLPPAIKALAEQARERFDKAAA